MAQQGLPLPQGIISFSRSKFYSQIIDRCRLSENPEVLVGVIEAGQYLVDDPLIDTPRAWAIRLGEGHAYMTMLRVRGATAGGFKV